VGDLHFRGGLAVAKIEVDGVLLPFPDSIQVQRLTLHRKGVPWLIGGSEIFVCCGIPSIEVIAGFEKVGYVALHLDMGPFSIISRRGHTSAVGTIAVIRQLVAGLLSPLGIQEHFMSRHREHDMHHVGQAGTVGFSVPSREVITLSNEVPWIALDIDFAAKLMPAGTWGRTAGDALGTIGDQILQRLPHGIERRIGCDAIRPEDPTAIRCGVPSYELMACLERRRRFSHRKTIVDLQ